MCSSNTPNPEQLLKNLVHDLRQPLSNIETSVYFLSLHLRAADPQTREQIRTLEHQVERAAAILSETVAALNCHHTAVIEEKALTAAAPL